MVDLGGWGILRNREILVMGDDFEMGGANAPLRTMTKTTKTATAIDYIITNSFAENTFETATIKSDVSDHFPVCIFIP